MPPREQLDYIHGLRGAAAYAVVVQHTLEIVHEGGVGWFDPLLTHLNLGRFGVVLFFLISGFVVPYSLKGEQAVRHFAISRFLRLYPAYWVSLLVLTGVAILIGHRPTLATFAANITMVQGLWEGENISSVYWTLLYELMFYLACVLLYWRGLLGNIALNAAIALILLLVALLPAITAVLGQEPLHISPVPFLVSLFFTGLMLRRATVENNANSVRWAKGLVPLTVLAGCATGGLFFPVTSNLNIYFPPVALSAAMAVPVLVFVLIIWAKPKTPKWLMHAGTISYSVYLFQDIGLHLLPKLITPGSHPLAYIAAMLTLTTVVAGLVYRFVEKPVLDLRHKWLAR